jgi:dual specificity MAP kinase phosphatase
MKNTNLQKKTQSTTPTTCPICLKTITTSIKVHLSIHPSKVYDWLYIGSYSNATNKKDLESIHCKTILNCASECKNLFENEPGYKYLKLNIKDTLDYPIEDHFTDSNAFLSQAHENNETVFVHCQLGKSRSATIIIAYLIKHMNMSTNEAYTFLKRARSSIMPNLSFMNKLRSYEQSIHN